MLKHLLNLLSRFRPHRTEWVEDLPERLRVRTVYIVGGRAYPYEAVLPCPLRCGEKLHVGLTLKHEKSWRINEHAGGEVSLSPSIWLTTDCRCHFWLRKGKIIWCESPPLWTALRRYRNNKPGT